MQELRGVQASLREKQQQLDLVKQQELARHRAEVKRRVRSEERRQRVCFATALLPI